MTKHRSVVTGYDADFDNGDGTTGRPKGVQTAADMRRSVTYDVLGEGIFAIKGVPTITGSPTNTATISAFMAAIAAPTGGFYTPQITNTETITINMANVGAVKIYVQQKDWEVDSVSEDSEVVIGVVYGATEIPAGSILLFTTTVTSQTSTSGLTFTPAFKYTGAASGAIRVPTQSDLANITVIQNGSRGLVTTGANAGEFIYSQGSSSWISVNPSNNIQANFPIGSIYMNATNNTNPSTLLGFGTWSAFGAGRVPVGFDSSQTEFNAAQKTGGAKTVSLTAAQNGKHSHSGSIGNGGVHNHGIRVLSGSGNGFEPKSGRGGMQTGYIDGDGLHSHSLTIDESGSGSPHNNLQPYITVYMWRRTA